MQEIKTIYRGYEIIFRDNSEEWCCTELVGSYGNGSSYPKLSTVKAKIDNMIASLRKKSTVSVYDIQAGDGYGNKRISISPAIITEYIGQKSSSRHDKSAAHRVATMAVRGGKSKPSRTEGLMTHFMLDTPENHAAVDLARAAHVEVVEAIKRLKDAVEAIPRVTLDDIRPLVDIYEAQQEQPTETEQQ